MTTPTTNCKKCIFAQHNGNEQYGCVFDVPKNLLESFGGLYDSKNVSKIDGYYQLVNFKCPYGTTEEWKNEAISSGISPEDLSLAVLQMTGMSYYLVYILDEDIYRLETNLMALSNMNCKPKFISFIKPYGQKTSNNSIIATLQKFSICGWKLHDIVNEGMAYDHMIDMVLDTNLDEKYKVLSVWNNKFLLSNDYYDRANQTLNYFLNKPAYVLPNDNTSYNGICLPISAYVFKYKKILLTTDYLDSDTDIYKLYVM